MDLQAFYKDAGGFGTYQTLVCIAGFFISCFTGLFMYDGAFINLISCSSEWTTNGTESGGNTSQSLSFNHGGFKTSVSVEYGLCDEQASLGELSSVFLLTGCIPGSLLAGPTADILGRVPGALVGLLGSVAMNVVATFSPYYWLHLASRLLCGIFVSWCIEAVFVYGNEALLTEHRCWFVRLFCSGSPTSSLLLSLLAFILRAYKPLMTANNFFAVPAMLILVFLPESPSWLAARKGKHSKRVTKALSRIAHINRCQVPAIVREREQLQKEAHVVENTQDTGQEETIESDRKIHHRESLRSSLKILLSNRTSVERLCTVCLFGFSSGLSYFGFTYVIAQAVPNIYITIALMSAVEPPCLFLLNLFSRSQTLFYSALSTFSFSAAIGIFFIFIDASEFSLSVSIILVCLSIGGKAASNTAISTIIPVGTEIYPTAVRNTGLGLMMASLRIGCMLSPMVNFIPYVPARFGALGLACLVAALPARRLPDTRLNHLTDFSGSSALETRSVPNAKSSDQST